MLTLDHAVIAAPDLADGAAELEDALGIGLTPGGRHPLMATHNRVTGTGNGTYLELMAPVPDEAPERPRWLALDTDAQRARIAERPRPVAWMAKTADLDATLAAAREAGLNLGEPLALGRGPYAWRVAIRPDGSLAEGGTVPIPLEWHGDSHPSDNIPDQGLRYDTLHLAHPAPERLREVLDALGVDAPYAVEAGDAAALALTLTRPDRRRVRLD